MLRCRQDAGAPAVVRARQCSVGFRPAFRRWEVVPSDRRLSRSEPAVDDQRGASSYLSMNSMA